MADNNRLRGWLCAVASAGLLAVSMAIAATASAQDTGPQIKSDGGKWIDMKSAPEVPPVAAPQGRRFDSAAG